jgi:hypothetical protein
MAKRPIAIGLSLCEQVVIEENTRNITQVNCFTERTADRFPSDPIPFVAFALLTDGEGEITMEVRVERLDTLDLVYRKSATARFTNPLQTIRCCIRLRSCSFPVPGQYQVTLLANGEFVAQRKIEILGKDDIP